MKVLRFDYKDNKCSSRKLSSILNPVGMPNEKVQFRVC